MNEPIDMSAVKVIEIMGVSAVGFDDAVAQAVSKAAESISAITHVEVLRQGAAVRDGSIARYEVTVKLSFAVR